MPILAWLKGSYNGLTQLDQDLLLSVIFLQNEIKYQMLTGTYLPLCQIS